MFYVPAGLSVNFRQLSVQMWDTQGTLSAAAGHSYKLLQLSMQLWYLLQLSMRLRDLLATVRAATGLQLTSINFLCISRNFDNIRQIFLAATGPSIYFPCRREALCKVSSTFRAAQGPIVNFLCGCGTL